MHEYAVTQSIVNIAVTQAEQAGAARVTAIHLVIGDLSSIMDDSVQLYFDLIAEGTLAQGAELIFERIATEFYCTTCQANFVKPAHGFDCPTCGAMGRPTEVGKEFYVASIEIE